MKYFSVALIFLLLFSCGQYSESDRKEIATISYIDRQSGETKTEVVPGEGVMKWLYSTSTGEAALHLLVKRKFVSELGGWYMDTRLSAKRIHKFVVENNINLEECKISNPNEFATFNNFFYRELKADARPIGKNIISPADGKIIAFQSLNNISSFFVKGFKFTIKTFLQDKNLANNYADGAMAIIRLAPADYHRFHFPAGGNVSASKSIKGYYFSVSPLALRGSLKNFCENYREYCILETKQYGDILIADVGATMVGSITQTYKANTDVKKGDEKGYFAFGGSTLVLLFEKDKITFDDDLISNTKNGMETYIKMGESIAK